MRTGAQLPTDLYHDPPKFGIQSSLGSSNESAARLATYIDELRSNASEEEDDAFDEDFGEDDIRHLALDE